MYHSVYDAVIKPGLIKIYFSFELPHFSYKPSNQMAPLQIMMALKQPKIPNL